MICFSPLGFIVLRFLKTNGDNDGNDDDDDNDTLLLMI